MTTVQATSRIAKIAAWRAEKGLLLQVTGARGFYLADREDTIRSFRDGVADFVEPMSNGWRLFRLVPGRENLRDEMRATMQEEYNVLLRASIA